MKFSVLVPAYNVDSFVSQTIESVINQTYKNWEMIIVNDGSTDKTFEIINKYALNDDRIKVINQENKGLLMARRVAIEKASGDYLCFLDSDDYWEIDTLETIFANNKKQNDLVIINFNKVDIEGNLIKRRKHIYEGKNKTINQKKLLRDFLKTNKLNNIWAKFVKREIIKQDPIEYNNFGKLMQGEDRIQSLPLIYISKTILFIDKPLYNYRTNPKSISHNFSRKNFDDFLTTEKNIEKYLLMNNASKELFRYSYNHFIYYLLGGYLRLIFYNKMTKEEKIKLIKCIKQNDTFIRSKQYLKLKMRIIFNIIEKERILILNIFNYIMKIKKKL